MMNVVRGIAACVALFLSAAGAGAQTFANPIIASPAADPSVILVNRMYYSVQSAGCHIEARPAICIRAAATLSALGNARMIPVWIAPPFGLNASDLWAPQIEYLDGTWYIYYAADALDPNDHTLFALVPKDNSKPLGPWQEANTGNPGGGFVTDWKSRWAIDPMVYKATDNRYYMLYACRQDNSGTPEGKAQSICLAPMNDPLHLVADPQTHKMVVALSKPTLSWELRGWPTQEGPFGFTHDGKDYILYSASFSGNPDQYTEGVLINDHPPQPAGGNPLTNPAAWIKQGPLFDGHHSSYGTASTVLVNSPDETELWQVYHGTDCLKDCPLRAGKTWIDRSDRAQQAWWSATDELVLGYPVDIHNMDGTGAAVPLKLPSTNGQGTSTLPAWGDAFGDAAENNHAEGRQRGRWESTIASEIRNTSLDAGVLDQSFFGANPNWLDYIVYTRVQMEEMGVGDAHAKSGLYGAYVDHDNWFAAMIDVASCGAQGCLTTGGRVTGVDQPWQNCPLPGGFDAKAKNTLVVQAVQGRFTILVNGRAVSGPCQDRRLDLSAGQKHAGNGQAGVLVENARAAFTDFDVSPGVPLDSQTSGQTYAFRNLASRLNLESGCRPGCKGKAAKGSGVKVRVPGAPYPLTTAKSQVWRLMDRGEGIFSIANVLTGLCIETQPTNGSAVQATLTQEPCKKRRTQAWRFNAAGMNSSFVIVSEENGLALAASEHSPGSSLQAVAANGETAQKWQLVLQ